MRLFVVAILFFVLTAAVPAAAIVILDPFGDAGADARDESLATEDAGDAGHAHDSHARPVMEPPTRTVGAIPSLADAISDLERRDRIVIAGDAAFNPANGVREGSGTPEDPFVISGYYVDVLVLSDTSRTYEVRDSFIRKLILDWTGSGADGADASQVRSYVHHNRILDLEVNRNVARTGDTTASVIEHNEIVKVTQLRHFDGIFRFNTVGDANRLPILAGAPTVVFNIAGLNAASIHDNVIHGGVDMKIHGHHHSDRPGLWSHNHAAPDSQQEEAHDENHSLRYIAFDFSDNHVIDPSGFGVRYNDKNHEADDRQATSEQEPALEKRHIHFTTVRLVNNTIEQAPLRVEIMNAADKRHVAGEHGVLDVIRNTIRSPAGGDAILIGGVRNAAVTVRGNVVDRADALLASGAGIVAHSFENVTMHVDGNRMTGFRYGVHATAFDDTTHWFVHGNDAGAAKYPVWWDDSVANPPAGKGGAHGNHDHEHGSDEEKGAIPADGRSSRIPTAARRPI